MLDLLARRWWVVLIRGLAAILLGVSAVLMPAVTLVTVLFVFGAFTVGDGLMAIIMGISTNHNGRIWWEEVLLGVLAIIAGAVAALLPGVTALILVYIIAISAIVRGVFEIAAAIQLRKVIDDEWILVLAGVVSLLFGGILLIRPGEGAIAMVILIGAYMIAVGAMIVAFSLRLRHVHQRLQQHAAPAEAQPSA
jgi:uncharacterized membrane protein HdeD (DUF308 family)